MIKKVKGAIFLPSGELFLDGDIEIEEQPALLDAKFIEQTRNFNEFAKKALRQRIDVVMVEDGIHRPTGPVIDSTIAEKTRRSIEQTPQISTAKSHELKADQCLTPDTAGPCSPGQRRWVARGCNG